MTSFDPWLDIERVHSVRVYEWLAISSTQSVDVAYDHFGKMFAILSCHTSHNRLVYRSASRISDWGHRNCRFVLTPFFLSLYIPCPFLPHFLSFFLFHPSHLFAFSALPHLLLSPPPFSPLSPGPIPNPVESLGEHALSVRAGLGWERLPVHHELKITVAS